MDQRCGVFLVAALAWLATLGPACRSRATAPARAADARAAPAATVPASTGDAARAPAGDAAPAHVARPAGSPTRPANAAGGGTAVDRTPACTREAPAAADADAVFDAHLVLEWSIVPHDGEATGFRLHDDGRLEARRGDEWAALKVLTPERMAEIRHEIAEAHPAGAGGTYRLDTPDAQAAQTRLDVRDGDHVAVIVADEPCFVPAVHGLLAELAELFE